MCWRCVDAVAGGAAGGGGGGESEERLELEREERREKVLSISRAVGPAAFLSQRDVARMWAAEREARRA